MVETFRLLRAKSLETYIRKPWRPLHQPDTSAAIEISFDPTAKGEALAAGNSHVSVLLGKNGQGKSRILSAIATTFQLLQSYARAGTGHGLPLAELEYLAGGQHHFIRCAGSEISVQIDGKASSIQAVRLPSKVIGLSMTPFDKFPIRGDLDSKESNVYAYLGMRQRIGGSSSKAILTRAINGVIERIELSDRGRLTQVFTMLGFMPTLNVVYRLEDVTALRALAEGEDADSLLKIVGRGHSISHERIRKVIEADKDTLKVLQQDAREILSDGIDRFLTLRIDLEDRGKAVIADYRRLKRLRYFGIVRLFAVEVFRHNGASIDLNEASSGELSVAITFLSLASNLENGSLVLIDEPEINLHPEWQARYVDLLLETFRNYRDCHYVLATHSPLILSDAPASATLASLNGGSIQSGAEVSGRPVDYLLVEAFEVASGGNYYVQEQLIKALRLAADGEAKSQAFQDIVLALKKIQLLIKDSPGIVEVINDLQKIAEKASNR